jgi:hypothetical protein
MKYSVIAIIIAIYGFVMVRTFNKLEETEQRLSNCQRQSYSILERCK